MNSISHKKDKFNKGWQYRLKIAIIIGILYGFLNLFGVGCPIKFLTGISCPGCGMTRAVMATLNLQFSKAFYYHPLFGLVPFMFALYLFEDKIKPIYTKYTWILIISLFLTIYVIRLFIIANNIVFIDISSGFVLKFIRFIF